MVTHDMIHNNEVRHKTMSKLRQGLRQSAREQLTCTRAPCDRLEHTQCSSRGSPWGHTSDTQRCPGTM